MNATFVPLETADCSAEKRIKLLTIHPEVNNLDFPVERSFACARVLL
jgi:hypothetical protein